MQCICCSEGGQEVRARLPASVANVSVSSAAGAESLCGGVTAWATRTPPVRTRRVQGGCRSRCCVAILLRTRRDTHCGDGGHGGRAACHRVAVAALPHARRPPLPTRSPSLSGGRQQRVDPPTTHGGTHGIVTSSGMHSPSFPPEVRRVDQLYCHSRSAPRWHGTNNSRD